MKEATHPTAVNVDVAVGGRGTQDDATLAGGGSYRVWFILLVVFIDVALLELSLLLGFFTRDAIFGLFGQDALGLANYKSMAVGILLIPAAYAMLRVYPGHGLGTPERIRLRVLGAGAMLIGLAVWDYVVQNNTWSRGVLLATLFYAPVLMAAFNHYLVWILSKHESWMEPVVVIGAGDAARDAVAALQRTRTLGYLPVAVLDDDPQCWERTILGVPVIGPVIKAVSDFPQVQLAIVTSWPQDSRGLSNLLGLLPYPNFLILPRELELQSLSVIARDFGGTLALEVKANLLRPSKRYQKLVFDNIIAIVGAIVTAPFFALFAVWIFLIDPGPVLYLQKREGYGGKPFMIFKLRTMYQNAEQRLNSYLASNPAARAEWEKYFKLNYDPRILPVVGNILRRLSIDELPQLWNVLRAEMAIVGPRPLPDYHVAEINPAARKLRQKVKPGITGLWQTTARADSTAAMMERLDTSYIEDWSVWLDVAVLLDTVIVVLGGKGAR